MVNGGNIVLARGPENAGVGARNHADRGEFHIVRLYHGAVVDGCGGVPHIVAVGVSEVRHDH